MKQQILSVTQKHINRAFRPTSGQRIKTGAGIILVGAASWLFYHALLPSKAYGQDRPKKGAKQEQVSDTAFASKIAVLKQRFETANPGSTVQFADTSIQSADGFLRFHDADGSTVRVLSSPEVERATASTDGKTFSGVWVVKEGELFYAYRATKKSQPSPEQQ